MTDGLRNPSDSADLNLLRRIDAVCRQFEADWRDGKCPAIDDYVGQVAEEDRAAIRAELETLVREREPLMAVEPDPVATGRPPSTVAEASTIAPREAPGGRGSGEGLPSTHEAPTRPPHGDATVDLGPSASPSPHTAKPTKVRYFGDYEIVRELARGGMGVVFEARQISLNRSVAVKMILAGQLADEMEVKRFYTEAEAAANLDHPGIVPIFEVGQHDGQHYFSMGFVEGQSLAGLLVAGPLAARKAAELMIKVADAIAYAHHRGLIHRDLKPANILLDRDGNPRVTDFGLAKKVQGDSGLTGSGQIMGTPSYMPPEQAGGRRGDVGVAADVYSLGATLYALITGRPPFQAATAVDTVLQVLSDEPVPPRRLNASIPLDLETICLKCLEKEPFRRYATASELAADLSRYVSGEPIVSRPISRAERAWKWVNRRPALSAALAACILALLGAAAGGTWFSLRLQAANLRIVGSNLELKDANDLVTRTNNELKSALDETRRQRDQARSNLYAADMALAQAAWDQARVAAVRAVVSKYAGVPTGERDPRGFEWAYFAQLGGESSVSIPMGGYSSTITFSPDGRQIFGWPPGHPVRVFDTATKALIRELPGGRGPGGLVKSPDGRLIAAGGQDQLIRLWDAASGKLIHTLEGSRGTILGLAFHPNGEKIVACSQNNSSISTWLVETGRLESTSPPDFSIMPASLAFSPDGLYLAVGGHPAQRPGKFQLRDARTGEVKYSKRGAGAGFAFSPDGRLIAAAADDGRIRVWQTASATEVAELLGHSGRAWAVAFRPDGKQLASVGEDTAVRLWDVGSWKQVMNLKGHAGDVSAVAFRPDGQRLATSDRQDGTVRIWDPSAGQESRTFRLYSAPFFADAIAFDPQGGRIASGSQDKTVKVWDSTSGTILLDIPVNTPVLGVAFHPNGRRLATAAGNAIQVWDSKSGKQLSTIPSKYDARAVAYSPDGRWITSAPSFSTGDFYPPTPGMILPKNAPKEPTYGDLTVWDAETGQEYRSLRGHFNGVHSVAFADDGRTLVSAGRDRTLRIWDVPAGREVRSVQTGFFTRCFALDSRSRQLAYVSDDQRVHVQSLESGSEILALTPHCFVRCMVFANDGRRLIVGGQSPAVKVWDLSTGLEILTLDGKDGDLQTLAFDPQGQRLATSHADGPSSAVKVWPAGGSGAP